jgi:hypothetical protein
MSLPLIILAIFSIFFGYITKDRLGFTPQIRGFDVVATQTSIAAIRGGEVV